MDMIITSCDKIKAVNMCDFLSLLPTCYRLSHENIEDEIVLFDNCLKKLFDVVACVYIGIALEISVEQIDEMYSCIISYAWLTMKKESYDYIDGCIYFAVVFKSFTRGVCCRQYLQNKLNIVYALPRLGFKTNYAI